MICVFLIVDGLAFIISFTVTNQQEAIIFEIAFWIVMLLSISVSVRRFHDRGLPDWLCFTIAFAPIAIYALDLAVWGLNGFQGPQLIADELSNPEFYKSKLRDTFVWGTLYGVAALIGITALILALLPSQPNTNKYGPNPLEVSA